MKTLLLFGAAALTLTGCADGAKCDTGDSACGVSDEVVIQDVGGNCTGSTCNWYVTATGKIGTVELDLIETGDPTWSCGPSSAKELICGVWSEYHNDFTLTEFDAAQETKEINLNLVADYTQQVGNNSTIFNVSDPTISNALTVLFSITDADGNYADCAKFGHDTSYFSTCSNDADLW